MKPRAQQPRAEQSRAEQKARDIGEIEGPLQGYHREWYVVRAEGPLASLGRVKVGEPRDAVLWFDRRCFASEEELVGALAELGMPHLPPLLRLEPDGPPFLGYIEGKTLAELSPRGNDVAPELLGQIIAVFRSLARVRTGDLPVERTCSLGDRAAEGDTGAFLHSLLRFTLNRVYRARHPVFGRLFDRLGVTGKALEPEAELGAAASRLTGRPFCLLHGDLHRANFIVDAERRLWTIDWELAMLGDPLYDLATHLHLMRYPERQEKDVIELWKRAVDETLPGATEGYAEDLPRYLAYKRVQSVFTDVVRQAIAVRDARPEELPQQLGVTAKTVHHVLERAAGPLGLDAVPAPGAVEDVYAEWAATSGARFP
ncbi:aminoglycoside phosphotransferase family protein [Streptomyces sp. ODS28]|uniref:aminoglycoside phosphotransferase family protein n=1 Tax=Streptomyces sp. ODS28 TaxID=3136688 RepID=UPI0031F11730